MAIATKKLLADGLKELLEKKTLDKITVKELVATCLLYTSVAKDEPGEKIFTDDYDDLA